MSSWHTTHVSPPSGVSQIGGRLTGAPYAHMKTFWKATAPREIEPKTIRGSVRPRLGFGWQWQWRTVGGVDGEEEARRLPKEASAVVDARDAPHEPGEVRED